MKLKTFLLYLFTFLMLLTHIPLNALAPFSPESGIQHEFIKKTLEKKKEQKKNWKEKVSHCLLKRKIKKSNPKRKARLTLMNGVKINGRIIKATKDSIYLKRPLLFVSRKSLKKYEQGELIVLSVQAIKIIKLILIAKLRGFLIILGLGVLFSLGVILPNLGTSNPDGLSALDIGFILGTIATVGGLILGGLFSLSVGLIHPDIKLFIDGNPAAFDLELLKSILRFK